MRLVSRYRLTLEMRVRRNSAEVHKWTEVIFSTQDKQRLTIICSYCDYKTLPSSWE